MFLTLNKSIRIFHILDSLPTGNLGRREATQLQNILLKHFEGAAFEQGRITINLAQVGRIIFMQYPLVH